MKIFSNFASEIMERLFKTTGNQSIAVESKKIGNKKLILKSIFFNGPLSNSVLSKEIKLSTPKINSLIIELIEDGLVQELGRGNSSGGRRPVMYGLVGDGFYVAGITINIHQTIISVFNSNNEAVSGPHFFPIKMQSDVSIFNRVNEKLEKVIN